MPNIFVVVDPRDRRIRLTRKRWYEHILANRPFMAGWEQIVCQAVQTPNWISQDVDFKDRQVYYYIRQPHGTRYLRVVVLFRSENQGEVLTAFPADSGKKGETILWPSSD